MENDASQELNLQDGLSIKLIPAPILKRSLAYLVDLAIVTGILYLGFILFMVLVMLFAAAVAQLKAPWMFFVLIGLGIIAMLVFYHGFFIYYEFKRGFTPGKKLFGLKVVSLDGSRVSMRQCVIRDMMRYIDCMLVVPGLISMNVSQKRQRLGDMLCATMVTHSERQEKTTGFLYMEMQQYEYLSHTLVPSNVPKEKLGEFLKFAYAYFVTKKLLTTPEEINQYARYFLGFCQGQKPADADDQVILRFFAEYGLKTIVS